MSFVFKADRPVAHYALHTLKMAKTKPPYAAVLQDALTWLHSRGAPQDRIEARLVRGGYSAEEAAALVDPIWNPA